MCLKLQFLLVEVLALEIMQEQGAYQPRFLWMWPNSRISVMGGDQTKWMSTIKDKAKSDRKSVESDELITKSPILEKYEEEVYASVVCGMRHN